MIIAMLVVFGLCLGSFVNALVWRLYQQSLPKKKRRASDEELSISKGRSMCTNCGHTLHSIDLIPVFSWLSLRGKCRYCRTPISWQYPLVEVVTAIVFVVSYLFWPHALEGWEVAAFTVWLMIVVGLMALVVYDLRWMLLPNRIVFRLYVLATLFIVFKALSEGSLRTCISAILGVLVGGGIFYLLFQLSDGSWIGGGDVKLGFLLGAIVGGPVSAAMVIFGASLLGSLLAIPLTITNRLNRGTRIPFGPFLIAAAVIVQLFGHDITTWYRAAFIDI